MVRSDPGRVKGQSRGIGREWPVSDWVEKEPRFGIKAEFGPLDSLLLSALREPMMHFGKAKS
jgi:hypothetical protein